MSALTASPEVDQTLMLRMAPLYSIALAFVCPLFAAIYWGAGHTAPAVLLLFTACAAIPFAYRHRRHPSRRSMTWGLAGMTFILGTLTLIGGGVGSAPWLWLFLVPMVAFACDSRMGFLFTGLVLLLAIVLAGVEQAVVSSLSQAFAWHTVQLGSDAWRQTHFWSALGLMPLLVAGALAYRHARADQVLDSSWPDDHMTEIGISPGPRPVSLRRDTELELLGRLAASIGHEVNNPLTYVMANIEHVANEIDRGAGDLPPGQRTELLQSLHEAFEGTDRIREIMSSTSLLLPRGRQVLKPVEITEVIERGIRRADNEIRHRATVRRNDETGTAPVMGNLSQLGQVLTNLVLNAAQAMPVGQPEDNKISISTVTNDETVTIEVADTGTGVPDEMKAMIFEPFFTTRDGSHNLGLGLYLALAALDGMGGSIHILPRPGGGTIARLVLKRAPADTVSDPPPVMAVSRPTPEPEHTPRVLVVEDEAEIRTVIVRMLQDFDVAAAGSGREALDICKADNHFDTILCDLMMPEMTGMRLYEELHHADADLAERMLFMTGGAFTDEAEQFLAGGQHPWVQKPLTEAALREAVLNQRTRPA